MVGEIQCMEIYNWSDDALLVSLPLRQGSRNVQLKRICWELAQTAAGTSVFKLQQQQLTSNCSSNN